MNGKDILQETIERFKSKFVSNFKGESDPEKILYFEDVLDDPNALNHHLAAIPALHAYWGSMKREAHQEMVKYDNFAEMWKQSKLGDVVKALNSKGFKTPTQKAIDAEFELKYRKDEEYLKIKEKQRRLSDAYEQITLIERATLTKLDVLKAIADLTKSMMAQGIYVYKNDPKTKRGAF